MLAPEMTGNWSSNKSSIRWRTVSFVLYCLVALVGALTVLDYGMSWDEPFRFRGGDEKLAYYKQLLAGEEVEPLTDTYPGLFDLPLAVIHEWFPEFGTRSEKGHCIGLAFGMLGIFAVWRLTACLGGERAGFWALLFLVVMPRYYGHVFMNPKDLPFAVTYILGVWAVVHLFRRMPKPSWRVVLLIGLSAGFALSTRVAGLLILFYFALFVGVYLLCRYVASALEGDRKTLRQMGSDGVFWLVRGLLSGAVALLVLAFFWPTLHQNPVEQLANATGSAQNYDWNGRVLMDGQFWKASDLPSDYVANWLLRTTPEHILVLLVVGVCVCLIAVNRMIRERRIDCLSRLLPLAVLGFSFVFPIVYIILKEPVLYDGMRHFLFVVPPAVCLSALTVESVLRYLNHRWRLVAQVSLMMVLLTVLLDMWRLHPYQYIYFNSLSGGLKSAYLRDETDYWGLSHKEAGDWLNAYVATLESENSEAYTVHQKYSSWMLRAALDEDRFNVSLSPKGADFYVAITRMNFHARYPQLPILHVVQRDGVPLCYIFGMSEAVLPIVVDLSK